MGQEGTQDEVKTLDALIQEAKAQCEAYVDAMGIVRLDETNMAIEAEFPNDLTIFIPMTIVDHDTDVTEFFLYQCLLSHITFAQAWKAAPEPQPATLH